MNKNYRNVWSDALGTWVAVPETASAKGKASRGKAMRSAVSLAGAGALWALSGQALAACNDTAGSVTATAGSTCHATLPSYSGTNAAYSRDDGSVLIFDQNVTLTTTTANVHLLTVGGNNGGGAGVAAVVHATGNLNSTVNATGSTAVSRPIYIYGGSNANGVRSLLEVDGNLTATTLGGQGAALDNAGGDIRVHGTTTLNSARNADAWRNAGGVGVFDKAVTVTVGAGGAAYGLRMSGGTLTFRDALSVSTAGTGYAIGVSGGALDAQKGATLSTTGSSAIALAISGTGSASIAGGTITTLGSAAHGVSVSGSGAFTGLGALSIDTKGTSANGILVQNAGKASFGSATITTAAGSASGLAAQSGGQITGTGAASVGTQGATATGVFAINASSIQVASTTVTTMGTDARGINANAGSTVAVDGLANVTTTGERGHAVLAGDDGPGVSGVVNLGSVLASTAGNEAHGLYAINTGSRIAVAGDAAITAAGPSAIGIAATKGGVVSVGGSTTVDHTSLGGSGVTADGSGSQVMLQAARIRTASDGRFGMVASNGAAISATQLDIHTAGAAADGIVVAYGAEVTATGAMSVQVTGSGTGVCGGGSALCVVGDGSRLTGGTSGSTSTIQSSSTALRMESGANTAVALDTARLTTTGATSDLISVSQATGTSSLTLKNSTATAGSGGLLLNVASGSTFAFDNDRTTLTGDIKASADSTVNMTLTNGSFLTGRIDPVNLTIDASSGWDVTGDSVLGTLSHAGTINMLPGAGGLGGTYKTVTVGNYVGNGGRINLNTYLGADNSPSDKLVIDGGTASGSTTLGITNAGGGGAPTVGKGIQVVQATGGATTATSAFSLAAPVSAGAYDYSLVRNGDESWYLTSALVPPPPPPAPPPPGPPGPPAPPVPPAPPALAPASLPNYRQETSLYAAVPSLAALHSAATMDSFHERLGAAGYAAGEGGQRSRLWVRVLGNNGERRGNAMGIYGRHGPSYDHKTAALQLGGDFYQGRNDNGTRTHAGVYVATGQTTGDVQHFNGTRAGSAKLDVTSLGLYWSVLGEQGGYVDFVAQGSHYGVKATSTRMPAVKTSGSGYDVSVEGGWPFALGGAWTLEPQVQVRLQQADLGSGMDLAGRMNYGDVDSLVGRAGLKLGYASGRMAAWARLDLLNEFRGRSTTTVSSLAGLYGVGFDSSVHGRSAALTVGVDAKLTQAVSIYGSASYRRALGDSRGHAWGAQAGVKVAW
ncbi:MAG: autotransporter outer membrane beta-barrel domain-containing protein [Proteobacteria bacterium]|nr:autotransporter outer membrane beta-barrel domain-containing protein [Pseudomonadota bacterium]